MSRRPRGAGRGGRFLGLRVAIGLNVGAYLTPRSAGPGTNNVGGLAGVYTTPAICVETTGVFSNTTPTGPYRGAGRPEATDAVERVIDLAARELGVDPVELRRRNVIPPSAMPFKTGLVFTYDCGEFARGMDLALALADRAGFEKRRAQARERGALLGLGIANPIEVAGGPYTAMNPDTAELRINPDGSVALFAGSTSMGQGNETAFTQLVSAGLGVSPDRIHVFAGDTDNLGTGRGNGGSGALSVGGSAVVRAVDKVIERGRRIAAHLLEAAHEDVAFRDGRFVVAGTDRGVTPSSVAEAAYQRASAPAHGPGFDERAAFTPPAVTFPNGCQVLRGRGRPRDGVRCAWCATRWSTTWADGEPHAGEGADPRRHRSGGSQGLFEDLVYDREAKLLSRVIHMDYAMPRADDMPFFGRGFTRGADAGHPLGARAWARRAPWARCPRALNAVNDALALGVRHSICRSPRSACGARSGTRRESPDQTEPGKQTEARAASATTTGSSHVYVGARSKPGTLGGVFRRAVRRRPLGAARQGIARGSQCPRDHRARTTGHRLSGTNRGLPQHRSRRA